MASFSKKLCRAVEKRKILYDRTLQQRVKRIDIDNAWDSVAAECNENVHSVKTRWRNIRKVLLRCISKGNTAQTRKTRSRDYYLYDELQFLMPHLANFGTDELIDSDTEQATNSNASQKEMTPVSVKDQTDDSNEDMSMVRDTESGSTPAAAVSEKSKRESKAGPTSPFKSLNATKMTTPHSGDEKSIANNMQTTYVITELPADSVSSQRFRRVHNASNTKMKARQQEEYLEERDQPQTPDPLQLKAEGRNKRSLSKVQRERSKSLYLERPTYDVNSDSDDDYNPPPRKKTAAVKEVTPTATSTMVTRKKAANKVQPKGGSTPEVTMNATRAENIVKNYQPGPQKQPVEAASSGNDTDNDDFAGIDMTLLAAAAEAEAAAAAEDNQEAGVLCPVVGSDAAVQCDFTADEEDDEFMLRMKKWQQSMTLRQKIIFRRGIYQAYIDVHDDPREFKPQKSADKYALVHGMPAIFSGMSPVELRLVRHLAMAVTGHKITSATSPFANFDNKTHVTSLRAGNLPITNTGNGNDNTPKQGMHIVTSNTAMRTPPEKSVGNGGGGGSGIVRTTAIALSNHNIRTGANVPRILRKVVRVGNNNSNGVTATNSSAANASNAVQSPNSLAQRNPSLLRPRLLTTNANASGNTGSGEKQRVYRILANGVVARQSPGPTGNSSPNNVNSPSSFSGNFAMLSNANHTSNSKQANQYRQILPKLPTVSAAPGTATTVTAAMAQGVTVNGETKLAGVSIRRHVPSGQDRTQMSRRYSVCGNTMPINETNTGARRPEDAPTTRHSMAATTQSVSMGNTGEQTKGTTRIRYGQYPLTAVRGGTIQPRFAVPSPVNNQSRQSSKSPNNIMTGPLAGVPLNEPVPVAMATWHTTQPNAEQEDQTTSLAAADNEEEQQQQLQDPIAPDEQTNIMDDNAMSAAAQKQNCIITSDAFENFVIKNEPLDLEDED